MRNVFRTRRPTKCKLGIQMVYKTCITDKRHYLQCQRSRSQGHVIRLTGMTSGGYSPISWERNVLEIPKLLGRLPTPPAITRTSFKVKGQRSRSSRRLMLRSEVHHIFRTERSTNLVCRWRTKTCITNKRHDLQGQRSKSRCHMVRLTGVNP